MAQHPIHRRRFLQSASVAVSATALTRSTAVSAGESELAAPTPTAIRAASPAAAPEGYPLVVPGFFGTRAGIQLGTQLPPTASDEDLAWTRQLGVEWVMTSLPAEECTLAGMLALKQRFADHGLKIYRLANHRCHNMEAVTLNLPERDAKIEEYLTYLRNLGQAGIRYATYAHMGNGIWSSDAEVTRGGATARALRLTTAVGHWDGKQWQQPLSHGRRFSEEEIWDNFGYFIKRVVPVAENAGVWIGIHPDDPPVYDLGGVPRCIFGNFAGYNRALEMASSPNIGVCFCVGSWIEGGEATGKNVLDAIRHFATQGKIFKVHFRNITQPLPDGFVETFPDDGYVDLTQVIRVLSECQYQGAIISDHLPSMVGGRRSAEAFALGYLRALIQANSTVT